MALSSEKFSKRVIAGVALTILLILVILLVINAINVLLMLFASILLAVLLRGLAEIIAGRTELSVAMSVLLVLGCFLLLITAMVFLIGPGVAKGVERIQEQIPEAVERFTDSIEDYGWGRSLLNNVNQKYEEYLEDPEMVIRITGIFSTTLGIIGTIVLILVLSLYFTFDPKTYKNGVILLIPPAGRKKADELFSSIATALRWWTLGQVISMAFVGVLTYVGLLIIGIPLAFTLSVIAFLFTFVPLAGPIASAIPAIMIAYIQSPMAALYVIILYIILQNLETYLLTPMIQEKAVKLPPALLILSQILVSVFLGIFGLILAAPLLVTIIVVVQKLYVDQTLGEKVDALGE
jgi:predicted PurR-regulated permease PerM